ncbi:MAG: 2-C-methyl-D-erythritol 4-phosphate cytidylyltransferase [Candidatus Tectomicrobia bacterium]|uniref:2-C-methyl-D-erythritol 4-phosphate cytidylyltransferase n=1 Tax=Tectimicrobiota bacterium TaxID=2528274 RepID=A0A932CMM1_UNCTE|nr:2-C-methyl-D-erythritol 4-phosphate cytidylyltransferase [Candidatus Tectomicrobia bacterium]
MRAGAAGEARGVALVPAAGSGRRLGGEVPKQFCALQGKPVLVHTLQRLQGAPGIEGIYLIVPPAEVAYCQRELVIGYGLDKVVAVVEGGPERQDSVYRGLCRVEGQPELVLVHDGVRPFVSARLLEETLAAAERFGAAIAALPCTDTIKEVDGGGTVCRTLDRKRLWQVQTPQAFRFSLFHEVLERARAEGFQATDEAALVEWAGHPVRVVSGEPYNLKVTVPADLPWAEWLLEKGYV